MQHNIVSELMIASVDQINYFVWSRVSLPRGVYAI